MIFWFKNLLVPGPRIPSYDFCMHVSVWIITTPPLPSSRVGHSSAPLIPCVRRCVSGLVFQKRLYRQTNLFVMQILGWTLKYNILNRILFVFKTYLVDAPVQFTWLFHGPYAVCCSFFVILYPLIFTTKIFCVLSL